MRASRPCAARKRCMQRRRAGAVDVVVAEHGDGLVVARSPRRAAPRPCPCRARVLGSGISALTVGSSAAGTSSRPMPREASTRPSSSGRPWRWLMADGGLGGGGVEPVAPGEAARRGRDAEVGAHRQSQCSCELPPWPRPPLPPAILCRLAGAETSNSRALHSLLLVRSLCRTRVTIAADWANRMRLARSPPPCGEGWGWG